METQNETNGEEPSKPTEHQDEVGTMSPYQFATSVGQPVENFCFVALTYPIRQPFERMMQTLMGLAVDLEMMRRGDAPASEAGFKSAYEQVENALEWAGLHKHELAAFVEGEIKEMVGEEEDAPAPSQTEEPTLSESEDSDVEKQPGRVPVSE